MLAIALSLLAQDVPVLVEDFDREPPRDAIYFDWERVIDATHPLYNAIRIEERGVTMRSHGRSTALQHRGREADERLAYRLTVTSTGTDGISVALRWLGANRRELREDRCVGTTIDVERPPSGAARVQAVLRFDAAVEGSARFDVVRLVARPRLDLAATGRVHPIFTRRDRIAFLIAVPSHDDAEISARITDADGVDVRPLARDERGTFSCEPLLPGAYRLRVAASRLGAPAVSRETWIYVLRPPLLEPHDPPFGVRIASAGGDPASLCDLAGARHVVVALPGAAECVLRLAERTDTSISGLFEGTVDRDTVARLRLHVDRWIAAPDAAFGSDLVVAPTKLAFLAPAGVAEVIRMTLDADRRLIFDAREPSPALYALGTLNDLLAGARPARPPAWAPNVRAFETRGRTVLAITNVELQPPAGWIAIDPLKGVRDASPSITAGPRTIFLLSPR